MASPPKSPLESAAAGLLGALGIPLPDEVARNTPQRVAEAYAFLTAGYSQDARAILQEGIFQEEHDEMVLVRDIELHSLCEHHLLPFSGRCHIAYLPDHRVIGLSKLARVVDVFARRLQVQERLTRQIADALDGALAPKGVAVVVEARHLCMIMRGVQKHDSVAVTSCMVGRFRSDARTRAEFIDLINRPR